MSINEKYLLFPNFGGLRSNLELKVCFGDHLPRAFVIGSFLRIKSLIVRLSELLICLLDCLDLMKQLV